MALKYNPKTGEFEEEKPVALRDLVFDPISGEFKAPESKVADKNESNDMLSQLKQSIRDLLEKVQVTPGVTTVRDMLNLGYEAKECESFVSLSKSGSSNYLSSNDKNHINYVYTSGAELLQYTLWNQNRKYADWCSLFRHLGFFVRERESPNQYKAYYSAKFNIEDKINGIVVRIGFFVKLKSVFSEEISVPIRDLSVEYDIMKVNQFNAWLYGTDNKTNTIASQSEKSYGITGNKTVKQIIESPLGDASVELATATFDSLQEWIRQKDKWWQKVNSDATHLFRVSTKLLGNKINSIKIFNYDYGYRIAYELEFKYLDNSCLLKDINEVIELGKAISHQLLDLGFTMKDAPLLFSKDKYCREGELGNRKVKVRITDYDTCSTLAIWLYVNQ